MTASVQLTKHHGLANDFLVYDLAQGDPAQGWADLARRWCKRRTGIGADGLLLLGRDVDDPSHLTMVLHNADGSRAEMSGNGIRCLAQAAYLAQDRHGPVTYRVTTDAGDKRVDVVRQPAPDTLWISVEMGVVGDAAEPAGWDELGCHPDRPVWHLDMGNPHSVIAVDAVAEVPLESLGPKVAQVNLEVVEPGPELYGVTMRVHERGAGITQACGTGASAVAWAAWRWGLATLSGDEEIVVHQPGGDAYVRLTGDDRRQATLSGATVFVGTVSLAIPTG
jgi:diaminopimelate epimerase